MMRFALIKICALLMTCDFISCQGYFTLTGPSFIRVQSTYHVTVAYEGYKTPEVLQVNIIDSETRNKTILGKNVTMNGQGSQNIAFDIKSIPIANYHLEAKTGSGKTLFRRLVSLSMNNRNSIVLFQTDKAKYKPSDKVQFRVLFINAETQPQNVSKASIQIIDPDNNRVKQFDNIVLTKGVFQGELQLAELAVLGLWQIQATINGADKTSKGFEVEKYVLPNIELSIDTDSIVSYEEGRISAKVQAKYTFGQFAKGKATVVAEVQGTYVYGTPPTKPTTIPPSTPTSTTTTRRSNPSDPTARPTTTRPTTTPPQTSPPMMGPPRRRPPYGGYYVPGASVSKTIDVDGKKPVVFDLEKELMLTDKTTQRSVTLTATFIDELTGRELTATARVTVRPSTLTLNWNYDGNFKPSLPYNVVLNLKNKNLPVTDKKNPVEFKIVYVNDKPRMCNEGTPSAYQCREEFFRNETMKAFPDKGFAKIKVTTTLATTRIEVSAKYLKVEAPVYFSYVLRETNSQEYLKVQQLNENTKFSESLKFNVMTTNNIDGVTYQIHSKGDVVASKYIKATRKSFNFQVAPTLKMIPNARLIVHYITKNGEIISDSLDIKFGNELKNFIKLKLSKEKAQPGEDLNIVVKAKPNSFVGLLGVDQSVLLLKSGNDIESKTVFQSLQQSSYPNIYNPVYFYDPVETQYQYYRDFNNGYSFIVSNAKPTYYPPYVPIYSATTTGRPQPSTRLPMQTSMPGQNGPSAPRRPEQGPAGPSGPSENEAPAVQIRKEFPETWFFDSLDFDRRTSSANLKKKIPDTITSWIISGFSIDPSNGLGLTEMPSKLTVFRPFFVALDLPYSIKRGEVIAIKIQVYNYQDSDVEADVVLHNIDEEFEYAEVGANQTLTCTTETEKSKTVSIKAQGAVTVIFLIRPLKVGQITIKVVATTDNAGDGIEKQLIVEPEGITQYRNKVVLIDLIEEVEFASYVSIEVPSNAVADSTRIEASLIGDILGPTFDNLENLLRTPGGCGEQNMMGFVPNIVVIEYLTAVKKLTPELESRAKKNMEKGYQGQLSYKHNDGSYSAWGPRGGASGSTWLTAYVAKAFIRASKYVLIDEKVITQALDFLAKIQAVDGSFPEVGRVMATYMQGGASKGLALTAYTLITFLERKDPQNKYKSTIDKALSYIIKNLESLDDTYSIAITAYALQIADHPEKDRILELLNSRAINENGMKYWKRAIPPSEANNPYYNRPSEVNVEMSAYALMAFVASEQDDEGIAIMRWLITQRNKFGGFQSTQDTVVGLQALAIIGAKIYTANNKMDITLTPYDHDSTNMQVNEANALIVQKFDLPSEAREFDIVAEGKGLSILQISYRYNVDYSGEFPRFNLQPKVNARTTKSYLSLTVCTSFIPDSTANKSNMAVMETSLPSGFTLDSFSESELLSSPGVRKVELKSGSTLVVVYFDEISTKEVCINMNAYRVYEVALQKPSSVIIYDYYDNTRIARSFYSITGINPCDICNGARECIKNCRI